MKLIVLLLALLGVSPPAFAQDCNKKCCKWGVCEFLCKTDCEAKKALGRATGQNLSSVPGPPGPGDVEKALLQSCAAAFQLINNYVIISQGSYAAGSDALLLRARSVLIGTGLFQAHEFSNVQLRWAQIRGHGQAPDRNVVFISDEYLRSQDLYSVASIMAHEMVHIRQYHRMKTTDDFKCKYSQEYVRTGGRQDNEHYLEREAYEFNASTNPIIQQYIANAGGIPSPASPQGQLSNECVVPGFVNCQMPYAALAGTLCQCNTPFGIRYGTVLGL